MQKVTLPTELLNKLGAVSLPAELCDEAGAIKAIVLPPELYHELMMRNSTDPFSEEEIQRTRDESGGYSTNEAIAYLNKLVAERGGR